MSTTESRQLAKSIQSAEGPVAQALMELNRICLRNRHEDCFGPLSEGASFVQTVPDRDTLLQLVSAIGACRWPGSYGHSPYAEVYGVLVAAVNGRPLDVGALPGQRNLHQVFVAAYAPPAAKARWELGQQQLSRRYPRLLRAMQHGALLTPGEAEAALWVLLRRPASARAKSPASSEAVSNFGGNLRVVQAARRWRQRFARTAITTSALCAVAEG